MDINSLNSNVFWEEVGPLTLEERVYRFLHGSITNGTLPPGSSITGSRLAIKLGVSRITVANALKRLSSEGFVVMHPHREAVVASLDTSTLSEIFRIRYALEAEAITELATSITPEDIARLRELDNLVRESLLSNDAQLYRRRERQFHFLVYELSGLPLISSILIDLWNRLEPYRGRRYASQLLALAALDDHQKVLAALERHEIDVAVQTMRKHVERGHQRFLQILNPDIRVAEKLTVASGIRPPEARRRKEPFHPPAESLREAFESLPDTRRRQGLMHPKGEVLAMSVCAMLCGCQSRYAIAGWIATCPIAIRHAIGCREERVPSGPTIHRVFTGLQSGELESVLERWMRQSGFAPDVSRVAASPAGVHGEQLPGCMLIAELAVRLRNRLRASSEDIEIIGTQRDSGPHWDRFFGHLLHGIQLPNEPSPAEMHLHMVFMHRDVKVQH